MAQCYMLKNININTCKENIFTSLTVVQLTPVPMDTGTCTPNLKFSQFCYSLADLRDKIECHELYTNHPNTISAVSTQSPCNCSRTLPFSNQAMQSLKIHSTYNGWDSCLFLSCWFLKYKQMVNRVRVTLTKSSLSEFVTLDSWCISKTALWVIRKEM